jgi:hypothetical protein
MPNPPARAADSRQAWTAPRLVRLDGRDGTEFGGGTGPDGTAGPNPS